MPVRTRTSRQARPECSVLPTTGRATALPTPGAQAIRSSRSPATPGTKRRTGRAEKLRQTCPEQGSARWSRRLVDLLSANPHDVGVSASSAPIPQESGRGGGLISPSGLWRAARPRLDLVAMAVLLLGLIFLPRGLPAGLGALKLYG